MTRFESGDNLREGYKNNVKEPEEGQIHGAAVKWIRTSYWAEGKINKTKAGQAD